MPSYGKAVLIIFCCTFESVRVLCTSGFAFTDGKSKCVVDFDVIFTNVDEVSFRTSVTALDEVKLYHEVKIGSQSNSYRVLLSMLLVPQCSKLDAEQSLSP